MNLEVPESALATWLPLVPGVLLLALQAWLTRRFATIADLTTVSSRVTRLESKAEDAPNHEDVVEIEHRLGAVEIGVGEIRGQLQGINQSTARIEHWLQMLVQAHLPDEGGRGAQ